jgi:hypothetical protein
MKNKRCNGFSATNQVKSIKILLWLFLSVLTTQAQLTITVSPPKITGQKIVVPLAMTNNLAEPVASARAACFLLDDQGKMVGQSAKWVIGGGKDHPALPAKSGTIYNFVITSPQPLIATKLTAKLSFSRILLSDDKPADANKDVIISNTP